MNTAKSLSEEKISTIRAWAEEGAGIPEIQKRLSEELDLRVTYLETRFLLEDLQIEIKLPPAPEPEPEKADAEESGPEEEGAAEDTLPVEGDSARITIDAVLRPGAIVSGKVHFAGGNSASWWLDQMGRLGMNADDPEFRPDEAQMIAFQRELQAEIQKGGY